MGRPTTASKCSQQFAVVVVVTGKTATVACARGEGHPGDHGGRITSPRAAATPPGRRV